jgi:hypothetical protein
MKENQKEILVLVACVSFSLGALLAIVYMQNAILGVVAKARFENK